MKFFVIVLALLMPTAAMADGALAVGYTGNVNRDGFAVGYSTNYDTPEEARKTALSECRTATNSGAQKSCKIVATFKNQCVAIAMDPKDGTPGVGWAVDPIKADAEKQAMEACKATAGNRARFCEVSGTKCDGTTGIVN